MRVTAGLPGWLWIFPAMAAARSVGWTLLGGWRSSPIGAVPSLLLVLGLSLAGAVLVVLGRPQPAPIRLGALFLLAGSSFAGDSYAGGDVVPATILAVVDPSVLTPAFAWALAAVLPRVPSLRVGRTAADSVVLACAGIGLVLFVESALSAWGLVPLGDGWSAGRRETIQWIFIYLATGAALAWMAVRLRHARPDEKRRGTVFLTGLILGASPALVGSLILLAVPRWEAALVATPLLLNGYRVISWAGLLLIPVVTFYAVLADRALGVRQIARVAIRTSLARQGALIIILAPLLLGLFLAWRAMGTPGPEPLAATLLAAGLAAGSVALILMHSRVLGFVDRHFFPDVGRSGEELERLATQIRSAPSRADVAGMLRNGLAEGLGIERVFLLRRHPDRHQLVADGGEAPPLPLAGEIGERLERAVTVRVRGVRKGARSLASEIAQWAMESGAELLVPLPLVDPLTVLAFGEKSSGLPLTRADEYALARVAAACADAIRRLEPADAVRPDRSWSAPAFECPACGRVLASQLRTCPDCGVAGDPAPVPPLIAGKFRVLRRLGAGAAGVVYEAEDLDLGRAVAIKTLPSTSASGVEHLRREARFMARLSHPHLATIHGIEVWQGTPILVLELFVDGSLADRLQSRGPLAWQVALRGGIGLASALELLHANRLLHGDVKPSNVGFGGAGTMKLLDFGLSGPGPEVQGGTIAWLPPEALTDARDGVRCDLWGLALTLLEAISGEQPFLAPRPATIIARMLTIDVRPILSGVRGCPAQLADLLASSLSRDPADRPGSAAELSERLRAVEAAAGARAYHRPRPNVVA